MLELHLANLLDPGVALGIGGIFARTSVAAEAKKLHGELGMDRQAFHVDW